MMNEENNKAQTETLTIKILKNALREAGSKHDAEELACLVIKLSEGTSGNAFWRMSEILLLRMAIIQALEIEKEERSFDKLLALLESDSRLQEQSEWKEFEQNSSASFKKLVIAGLGTRLRHFGVATAA